MYVDCLVDFIPSNFKEEFGFTAYDEPLLSFVFDKAENRTELKEFGKKLWLPKPEILIATKLKSLPNRTKDHKKQKDICDLIALINFTSIDSQKLIEFIPTDQIMKSIKTINDSELNQSDEIQGLEKNTSKTILLGFQKNIMNYSK